MTVIISDTSALNYLMNTIQVNEEQAR